MDGVGDDGTVQFITEGQLRSAIRMACKHQGVTWDEVRAQAKRGWFDNDRIHNIWMSYPSDVEL